MALLKIKHDDIHDDAGSFGFDVVGKNDSCEQENGGNNHGVSGREGWLARAVGASVKDDKFFKNNKSDSHKRERN